MRPVIGIAVCGFTRNRQFVSQPYIRAIERSGGCPILLPCISDKAAIAQMISLCQGFLFCGGGDVTPILLDRPALSSTGETDLKTDIFQLTLLEQILSTQKPLFGICRGMQVINVACHGELLQDLSLRKEPSLAHMQSSRIRSDPCHLVSIKKGSLLHRLCGDSLLVNSFHHQAVLSAGSGVSLTAYAPDGIPEALELPAHPFALGVQWHPECMTRSGKMRSLFQEFVKAAM